MSILGVRIEASLRMLLGKPSPLVDGDTYIGFLYCAIVLVGENLRQLGIYDTEFLW